MAPRAKAPQQEETARRRQAGTEFQEVTIQEAEPGEPGETLPLRRPEVFERLDAVRLEIVEKVTLSDKLSPLLQAKQRELSARIDVDLAEEKNIAALIPLKAQVDLIALRIEDLPADIEESREKLAPLLYEAKALLARLLEIQIAWLCEFKLAESDASFDRQPRGLEPRRTHKDMLRKTEVGRIVVQRGDVQKEGFSLAEKEAERILNEADEALEIIPNLKAMVGRPLSLDALNVQKHEAGSDRVTEGDLAAMRESEAWRDLI
jgi:hypothetical protein